MTERYCRDCGGALRSGANYCAECGRDLGTAAETPQADTGPDQVPKARLSGRSYSRRRPSGAASRRAHRRESAPKGAASPAQFLDEREDTTLAALAHILGLLSSVLGPLVLYVVTDDPFVKANAANALNWQIMFLLYSLVSGILVFVLVGVFLLVAFGVANLAFCIVAAVRASEGDTWAYPLTPALV